MEFTAEDEISLRDCIIRVPCPDESTLETRKESHKGASKIFEGLCPKELKVVDVQGVRHPHSYNDISKCGWQVRYVLADEEIEIISKDLMYEIVNSKPMNVRVYKRERLLYPPSLQIYYSITCQCKVAKDNVTEYFEKLKLI